MKPAQPTTDPACCPTHSAVLLAVPTVADRLACSERTARNLIHTGRLPSRRLGHRRLVALSDLVTFIGGLTPE
ncbi:MAG: helix-turn-helix domain-containing protein [Actinobacteria bacterium]|nr:helix-turn-helix domain-containing protein [Actinomycetota bacterium]